MSLVKDDLDFERLTSVDFAACFGVDRGPVAPVLEELRDRLALEWHTPIALRVKPEGLSIPAADYQTLRLIVREAIVNALKHAQRRACRWM